MAVINLHSSNNERQGMAITIIPADLMPEKRTTDRKRNRINIPQSGAQVWSKMFEVVIKR